MRLMRFKVGDRRSWGIAGNNGVIDAGARLGTQYPDVVDVLEAGALKELESLAGHRSDHPFDQIEFLPPVRSRNAVLAVGRNYGSAYEDMGTKFPGHPSIFQRRYEAQVGHKQPLVRPKASHLFDGEAELALVIGRRGRHIAEKDAFSHIIGYSIFNDGSVVDWGDHTARNVTPGKNFKASGAFGPWMVTADELPDAGKGLKIQSRLNGQVMQSDNTDNMMFPVAEMLVYVTQGMTLEPGDIIFTGTPSGVGHARKPNPIWMKQGDVCEVEIEGIGVLRNPIQDEK